MAVVGTRAENTEEMVTSAEKAAGHSYMNPPGTWGRRGRPAYGTSGFPSDFPGVAATSTTELPSIFPKRDEAAGNRRKNQRGEQQALVHSCAKPHAVKIIDY